MELPELRTRIEQALLASGVQIGEYTFPNGEKKPAVVVGSGTPAGVEVTGLEVCIQSTPAPTLRSNYGGLIVQENWTVVLKRWGNNKTVLRAAAHALLKNFQVGTGSMRFLPEGSDNLEQATIAIPQHIQLKRRT